MNPCGPPVQYWKEYLDMFQQPDFMIYVSNLSTDATDDNRFSFMRMVRFQIGKLLQ